jgi:tetraacyldisaccharide 4'-kinase
VISIGNLTVGGTGKTSLTVHFARILLDMGAAPAVLSRGYRRSGEKSVRIVPPDAKVSDPSRTLGDEPALIRRAVPKIWLGLAPSRYRAGMSLLRYYPNPVFLLDDGFQHRKLHRDIDILVLDATQGLLDNRLLPRGTLREPPAEVSRADILVIHESGDGAGDLEGLARRLNPRAPILHAVRQITGMLPLASWKEGRPSGQTIDRGRRVYLVAAIGNPGRFQRDIERAGLSVCGRRFFRDHHRPSSSDWNSCIEAARAARADSIVITEKDAIKASGSEPFPIFVLTQEMLIREGQSLRSLIRPVLGVES